MKLIFLALGLVLLGTTAMFLVDISMIIMMDRDQLFNGFWKSDPFQMFHLAEVAVFGAIWGLGAMAIWGLIKVMKAEDRR